VRLSARPVVVHRLEVVRYEYPELVLDVTCGSGTYLRSLGRDIGEALGSAAVMAALRRTAVGPFSVEQACGMDELTPETIAARLLPPVLAVEHLPQLKLTLNEIEALAAGRTIARTLPADAPFAAAMDAAGQLVAIVAAGTEDTVKPYRNFSRMVR
jgi:tRNA pseudouridine55 synthase